MFICLEVGGGGLCCGFLPVLCSSFLVQWLSALLVISIMPLQTGCDTQQMVHNEKNSIGSKKLV